MRVSWCRRFGWTRGRQGRRSLGRDASALTTPSTRPPRVWCTLRTRKHNVCLWPFFLLVCFQWRLPCFLVVRLFSRICVCPQIVVAQFPAYPFLIVPVMLAFMHLFFFYCRCCVFCVCICMFVCVCVCECVSDMGDRVGAYAHCVLLQLCTLSQSPCMPAPGCPVWIRPPPCAPTHWRSPRMST